MMGSLYKSSEVADEGMDVRQDQMCLAFLDRLAIVGKAVPFK